MIPVGLRGSLSASLSLFVLLCGSRLSVRTNKVKESARATLEGEAILLNLHLTGARLRPSKHNTVFILKDCI